MIRRTHIARIGFAGLTIAAVELFGRSYLHHAPPSSLLVAEFVAIGFLIAIVLAAGKIYDQKFHSRVNRRLPAFLAVMGVASALAQHGLTTQAAGAIAVLILALAAGVAALGRFSVTT